MDKQLKIAIIGDFNFNYNAHHAINMAIEHSALLLDIPIDYYWLRLHEATELSVTKMNQYNGFWIASTPYENSFFLTDILRSLIDHHRPIFITGEGFKTCVEEVVGRYHLNPEKNKVISNVMNAVSDRFEEIEVIPQSQNLKKLYQKESRMELTNTYLSIYPQMIKRITHEAIDVEAVNQFEEPEIISLKHRDFCVATIHLPQICSTRSAPHPLITAFLNYCFQKKNLK